MFNDNIVLMCNTCPDKSKCKYLYVPVLSCRKKNSITLGYEGDFIVFLNQNFMSKEREEEENNK